MRFRTHACLAALIAAIAAPFIGFGEPSARAQSTRPAERPPEEDRFDNTVFRGELLRRGMTELLQYYKRTRPPAPNGIDAQLYQREQLLEQLSDASLSAAEREAALDEASAILETLLEADVAQARLWQWELELGKDYLFRRAERLANNILYRGWDARNAGLLAAAAGRAETIFEGLTDQIDAFLGEIDQMSVAQFRRVEREGRFKAVESIPPLAEYYLCWCRFYGTIARAPTVSSDRAQLQAIAKYLEDKPGYTETPHAQTGVQAQSLLLVGMCRRLLGDAPLAGQRLVDAGKVVQAMSDENKKPLLWVYILSKLELAKLARDVGQFKLAHDYIERLDQWRKATLPDNFALAMALGVQDATIYDRQAQAARQDGKRALAKELRLQRHRRLAELLTTHPENSGDLLQAVYRRLDPNEAPAALDALERNAMVAGLLRDAARLQADPGSAESAFGGGSTQLLNRAIQVGVSALTDSSLLGRELRPVALFNVAVAEHRLGKPAEAVARFLQLVREYPEFDRRLIALDYAVRISAEWIGRDSAKANTTRLLTLIDALTALDEILPDSDEAIYWRYFLGDALARTGKLEEAARYFADVPPTSENYGLAVYREVTALWAFYEQRRDRGEPLDRLRTRIRMVLDASRRCEAALERLLASRRGQADYTEIESFVAGAIVLSAEARLQPAIGTPERTLEILDGFENRYPDHRALIGRALRLRILAHQDLGQLEKAGSIVDLFLEREPQSAGAVMDQLLRQLTDRARRLRDSGRSYSDAAAEALSLARKLNDWAGEHPELLGEVDPESFSIRLAGALLLAGEYERALEFVSGDAPRNENGTPRSGSDSADALACRAEALYQLGRREEAQPIFYELWARLPEGSETWWLALLRSLQCHNAMGSDPSRIIAEIRKLRQTWPEMGEPVIRAQFDDLERACERRVLDGDRKS